MGTESGHNLVFWAKPLILFDSKLNTGALGVWVGLFGFVFLWLIEESSNKESFKP
jgi:hypothetical protein